MRGVLVTAPTSLKAHHPPRNILQRRTRKCYQLPRGPLFETLALLSGEPAHPKMGGGRGGSLSCRRVSLPGPSFAAGSPQLPSRDAGKLVLCARVEAEPGIRGGGRRPSALVAATGSGALCLPFGEPYKFIPREFAVLLLHRFFFPLNIIFSNWPLYYSC